MSMFSYPHIDQRKASAESRWTSRTDTVTHDKETKTISSRERDKRKTKYFRRFSSSVGKGAREGGKDQKCIQKADAEPKREEVEENAHLRDVAAHLLRPITG
jgi:hypothetical protein